MRCLSIHLTDLCNEKCAFCVVGSPQMTRESIDYSQVIQFLETNAGSFDVVNLHGGEPTIHPNFFPFLGRIKELGYKGVHLQTNGITAADPDFARHAVECGVDLFIVSLHGDDPVNHESQTNRKGGFKQTIRGIANVIAQGAKVRTNTVLTRQNLGRLKGVSELACRLGVQHVNFSNLHPIGSAAMVLDQILPTFEEIRTYLYPAVDMCLSQGVRVTLEGFPYCTVLERRHLCLEQEYRGIRMLIRGNVLNDYDLFMDSVMRNHGDPCVRCAYKGDCGGVYPEYIQERGWSEFTPVQEKAQRHA
jgi:MoaA/NifB/PqqE/SkfB family radical SAM enzyme